MHLEDDIIGTVPWYYVLHVAILQGGTKYPIPEYLANDQLRSEA